MIARKDATASSAAESRRGTSPQTRRRIACTGNGRPMCKGARRGGDRIRGARSSPAAANDDVANCGGRRRRCGGGGAGGGHKSAKDHHKNASCCSPSGVQASGDMNADACRATKRRRKMKGHQGTIKRQRRRSKKITIMLESHFDDRLNRQDIRPFLSMRRASCVGPNHCNNVRARLSGLGSA